MSNETASPAQNQSQSQSQSQSQRQEQAITINVNNSGNPNLEYSILSKHGVGKQLGAIASVVGVLLDVARQANPGFAQSQEAEDAIKAFEKMQNATLPGRSASLSRGRSSSSGLRLCATAVTGRLSKPLARSCVGGWPGSKAPARKAGHSRRRRWSLRGWAGWCVRGGWRHRDSTRRRPAGLLSTPRQGPRATGCGRPGTTPGTGRCCPPPRAPPARCDRPGPSRVRCPSCGRRGPRRRTPRTRSACPRPRRRTTR